MDDTNKYQLYSKSKADLLKNSNSEKTIANILECKNKIEDKRGEILKTINSSIEVSNKVGQELNEQTKSLKIINEELDLMEKKISLSKKLVKNLSSWFSIFRSNTSDIENVNNKESKSCDQTKFIQSDTKINDKIYDKTNKTKITSIHDTEEEKSKEAEFYDQLCKGLDVLHENSVSFKKILTEHQEQGEIIHSKVDKHDLNIKKNSNKLEKL